MLLVLAVACQPVAQPVPPTAATPQPAETPRSGGTLVVGVGNASQLDTDRINATHVGFFVSVQIYESLYRHLPPAKVEPWLAERTDVSADGLTWTLTLRSGVKFHDGTDFDAAAVKANFDLRNASPSFGFKSQIAAIGEIRVIDARTVQLRLANQAPALQVILASATFGMESPTAVARYPDPAQYRRNAAGTGPFKLESLLEGVEATLVRNDDYWGQKPYLDRLIARATGDQAAQIAALEAGDVHVSTGVPPNEFERLGREGQVISKPNPVPGNPTFLIVNNARKVFADKRVRQAIAYGVNREAFLALTFGLGEVPDSVVPPHLQGYARSSTYPYDPAKARALLAEAGVTPGTPLRLIFFTGGLNIELASLVKQDLDALGFRTQLETMDQAGWIAAVQRVAGPDTTWDLSIQGAGLAYADAENPLIRHFLSTNAPAGNWAHYNNPEVDRLLTEQGRTTDSDARNRLLARIQQIVLDDVSMYPLILLRPAYATAKAVRDIDFVVGSMLFARAWLAE